MMLNRRGFLSGLIAVVAAPAIVRIENIMPVKALIEPPILRIIPVNAPLEWLAIHDWNALLRKRAGLVTGEEYALDFARRLQTHQEGQHATFAAALVQRSQLSTPRRFG